jgi:hypothetical protein
MHAIDGFRRPRAHNIMSGGELSQITAPAMFCWGTGDPFLTPAQARPAIAKIPGAVLHEVPGGHGPWLEDPLAVHGSPPPTSPRRDSRPPPSARDPAGQIKAVLRAASQRHYIGMASKISTDPPLASTGQPFAFAVASLSEPADTIE